MIELAVTIDTEYVRDTIDSTALPNELPGNKVLCYTACAINLETGERVEEIFQLPGVNKRERRYFATIVGLMVRKSYRANIIKEWPKTLIVGCHFMRADLPGFKDFNSLKRRASALRNTYASAKKPIKVNLRVTPGRRLEGVSVYLIDTMLWAPAGMRALEALGRLVGYEKGVVPGNYIERMDEYRRLFPKEFERYAIDDAVITALYLRKIYTELLRDTFGTTGRPPPTLSAAAVTALGRQIRNDGQSLDDIWGFDRVRRRKQWRTNVAYHLSFMADCYHGGHNQAFFHGFSEKTEVIDQDIAGAYVTAQVALKVPDWSAVEITKDLDVLARADALTMAHVEFLFPPDTKYPCLPVRAGDYGLIFPLQGESYCCGPELVVARNAGATIKVLHGLNVPWSRDNDYTPFLEFARMIAEHRAKHPKGGALELAIKEMGNSTYGKTGQAVRNMRGRGDGTAAQKHFDSEMGIYVEIEPSRITQPAFAAYTTSLVRALLAELINSLPDNAVLFTATTDGFLSTAGEQDVNTRGSVARFFADLRQQVAGNARILETKGRVNGVIVMKTRGTLSQDPIYDNGAPLPPIIAKAGQRIDQKPEDKWELNRLYLDVFRNRTFETKFTFPMKISLSRQWIEDADLVDLSRTERINMDYDFKRQFDQITEREGCIAATTKPWATIDEFIDFRSDVDHFRKNNGRVIKTVADFRAFERWREIRNKHNAAGLKQDVANTVAMTLLLRGLATGRFEVKPSKAKIVNFANDVGLYFTLDMAHNARRRKGVDHPKLVDAVNEKEAAVVASAIEKFPGLNLDKFALRGNEAEGQIAEIVAAVEESGQEGGHFTPPHIGKVTPPFSVPTVVSVKTVEPPGKLPNSQGGSLQRRKSENLDTRYTNAIGVTFSVPLNSVATDLKLDGLELVLATFKRISAARNREGNPLTEREVVDAFPEISRLKLGRETKRICHGDRSVTRTEARMLALMSLVEGGKIEVLRRLAAVMWGGTNSQIAT